MPFINAPFLDLANLLPGQLSQFKKKSKLMHSLTLEKWPYTKSMLLRHIALLNLNSATSVASLRKKALMR
jgi:hypothetical protein